MGTGVCLERNKSDTTLCRSIRNGKGLSRMQERPRLNLDSKRRRAGYEDPWQQKSPLSLMYDMCIIYSRVYDGACYTCVKNTL